MTEIMRKIRNKKATVPPRHSYMGGEWFPRMQQVSVLCYSGDGRQTWDHGDILAGLLPWTTTSSVVLP